MLDKNDAVVDLELNNVVVDVVELNSSEAIIYLSSTGSRVAINSNMEFTSATLFWILENALEVIKNELALGFDNKIIVLPNAQIVTESMLSKFKVFDIVRKMIDLGATEDDILKNVKLPQFVIDKAKEYEEHQPIFKNNLREIVLFSNIDLNELADMLNITYDFLIELIEERNYIDYITMNKLCNLFELQPKDILGYECS